MKRKDCQRIYDARRPALGPNTARAAWRLSLLAFVACAAAPQAFAGAVRLWPTAVVVSDAVELGDLCEIVGVDGDIERQISSLVITPAPPVGGSRVIHMDMIRSALTQSGVNMAELNLRGAMQCAVSRPSHVKPGSSQAVRQPSRSPADTAGTDVLNSAREVRGKTTHLTLRQAVVDHFNSEFVRYGGTAEVVFDRTSDKFLDLSGPPYEFKVRRRGGSPLGLTSLEVDVMTNGRVVQTVPMVVQLSMVNRAVIARRAINQGATVRAADVDVVSRPVTRLDNLGFADVALVIGQRAKRFVPTGTLLVPGMLESVPLVRRGDYVKLTSVVGSVRVVTAARATEDGVLADVITVRAADNKRIEFDAVVVGPGAVRVGSVLPHHVRTAVAAGSSPR